MKALLSVAMILIASGSGLASQPTKAVPPEWLHSGRLVVPEYNFSISSPNPDSQWTYVQLSGRNSTTFLAQIPDGTKYALVVGETTGRMESGGVNEFVEGMKKTLPKDWQVFDANMEPTNVPVRDAVKYKARLGLPGGTTDYIYGYAISGKRSYQIFCISSATSEPLPFTTFVSSFTFLSSNTVPNPSGFDISAWLGILFFGAIGGAIVDALYVRRGGKRPSRNDKIGLLVAVGLCIAVLIFLGVRGAAAYTLGEIAAQLFFLVFIIWEVARWRMRRKHPIVEPVIVTTDS